MSRRQQGQRNPAGQPARWAPPPPQYPGQQLHMPPPASHNLPRPQYAVQQRPPIISWSEAFRLYLRDPHARGFLRFFTRIAPWAFPLTIADDVLDWIPGIDIITIGDDLLWPVFILAVLQALVKVRRYRNTTLPQPVQMHPAARPHSWDPPHSSRHHLPGRQP